MSTRPVPPPPASVNPPQGYKYHPYVAFNPDNKHVIYSDDGQNWIDQAGNPVPQTLQKKHR